MAEKSDVSKWATVPAAGAVAAVVCLAFYLIGRSFAVPGPTDFWRIVATPLAQCLVGAGAVAAALLALHNGSKIRAQDREHHRQTMVRDRETNLLDRYTTAAKQLGDDQSTIREAGVHALAALADDWLRHGAEGWTLGADPNTDVANAHSQARACIHLLCSYLRANHREEDNADTSFGVAEEAVRDSIVGVLRDRISTWRLSEDFWIGVDEIRESDRFRIDLSQAILSHTNWEGADLRNSILTRTILRSANLDKANFEDARLPLADLERAKFSHANFSHANLRGVNMCFSRATSAKFGSADARNARFKGAKIFLSTFDETDLRGAELEDAVAVGAWSFSKGTVFSDTTTWPHGLDRPQVTMLHDEALRIFRGFDQNSDD